MILFSDVHVVSLKTALSHFRKSAEILQMRKKCRLDIENGNQEAKVHLKIIDEELIRRGLRKPKKETV